MILHGIPNCDTVRKTKKWLDNHGIEYQFHDFRKDGLQRSTLEKWVKQIGWELLLNRRGTTWRQLPNKTKENIDEKSAITVMLESPAIIKRPILVNGKQIIVGFNEEQYQQLG